MTKLQTLRKLKETIEKEGVIKFRYRRSEEDGQCRYCAIGHLFHQIDPKILDTIDEEGIGNETVDMVIGKLSGDIDMFNKILDSGLDVADLIKIQLANDFDLKTDGMNIIDTLDGLILEETRRGVHGTPEGTT